MNTAATENFRTTRWTLVRHATGHSGEATLTEAPLAASAPVAASRSGDEVLRNAPARCLTKSEHAPMRTLRTNILLCGVLAAMLAAPFAGHAAAQGSPAGEKPKRTADEKWDGPHAAPGKLSITTAPAEARDLSKTAPPARDFGQKEYDLAKGRGFLLTDNGTVRQFDLPTPVVTDQESAKDLAALIAAIPPQERASLDAKPKHKDARTLYEIWQRHARLSGDIPAALIGELAAALKVFIGYNPTWATVPKLNELLPRLDASHDWKAADAIALLDKVAAVQDSPLQAAAEKMTAAAIRQGEALPKKFAGVTWGETQPNGLRAAWVLEPAAAEQRMGTALRARLLVQNTGTIPVMARVPTWHQGEVSARDAEGAEVQVSGIEWTTIARLIPVRLGPGEFIEINAPGVGLGPRAGAGPWAGPRVGSDVLAKPGEDLTLTHGAVPLDGSEVGMREDAPHIIGPGWWQAHIKARLARDLPLPADAAERTHLLDRAVRELFATAPTAEETAAFTADQTDGAVDALVQRLAARADVVEFSASLPTAPVKFRVLAADRAADNLPRVVLGPGEYPLSGGTATRGAVTLKIVGRPVGDRRTNDAQLLYQPAEATGKLPPNPHKLEIPDGWGTWAIVCRPGDGFFYLLHKGSARKIDYSKPDEVTDTSTTVLPAGFRDEVKRQFDIAGVPAESQAEVFEKPEPTAETPEPKTSATPLKLTPAMLEGFWSNGGLRRRETVAVSFDPDRAGPKSADVYIGSGGIGLITTVEVNAEGTAANVKSQKHDVGRLVAGENGALVFEIAASDNEPARSVPLQRRPPEQAMHETAQSLFKNWQDSARTDGKIPGALIGELAEQVDSFIKQYPDDKVSPKLAAVRPKLDASRDWTQAEVVAVLDEIAGIATAPLGWASPPREFDAGRNVQRGQPLPKELETAAWGAPAENGLRAAWLLEPEPIQMTTSSKEVPVSFYRLGTVLKARVLFHNTGKAPVVFQTETWHQNDGHKAFDANGAEIPVKATWFTGITPMATFHLAPGEYGEVSGHGIAIGAGEYTDERSTGAVGAIVEAKEGDAVSLSHTVDAAQGGWTKPGDPKDPAELQKRFYDEHKTPLPAGIGARAVILRSLTLDLTGELPTEEERTAFEADNDPHAIGKLIARLQTKADGMIWKGKLPTGETKFRVIAGDPNAAKAPRTATAPGRYILGDGVHLQVRQVTKGDKRTNSAEILFFGPDPKKESPHEPYNIALPDGLNSYCFIWERGSGTLKVVERGSVRTVDFSKPAAVMESRAKENLAPEYKNLLPPGLLWKAGEKPADERPKTGTVKLTPEALRGAWSGTMNGKRLLISFHRPPVETEVQVDIYTGDATIGALAAFSIAPDGTSVALGVHDGKGGQVPFGTLHPIDANTMRLESRDKEGKAAVFVVLTGGKGAPATEPEQKEARELFEMWKRTANDDGTIPGTLIGALATEVRAYVKANPNLDSGMKLPKLLPRFVTSRDWTQAEAIKLLDDVAYYSTAPIEARVAKAKLGSGPMWRTMVEFQDIPVAIAKWSEAKDGLRIGLRVVGGQWSAGGSVRVELWLHNAGGKDVNFRTAGPNRQDVEVMFSAIDAEGKEHWPEIYPLRLMAMMMDCTLPAGHVAMAKEFDVTFADADHDVSTPIGHRFRDLKPGKYQLRCKWFGAKPEPAKSDKHIELTAPELDFTLVAQDAPQTAAQRELPPVDGQPARPKLADDRYAKSGVPLAEQTWPMPPWGAEKEGLSTGLRIIGEARIGGEVKAELWVRNSSAKDVKFSQCLRADVGLSVVAKDKDGKEHSTDITSFRRKPGFHHLLLPPGHIVKVKEFNVKFGAGKNDKLEPGWVNLQLTPGDYKLRAVWSHTTSMVAPEGEWTGKVTTGEVAFKLAAADAGADAGKPAAKPPGANIVTVPDDQYVKSGSPKDELVGEGVMWNEAQNGLSLGYRITGDEWRILGKDVKVELWVQNPGDKDVKFQLNMRPDIGLRMTMKGEKGAEHESNIVPSSSPPFGEHRLLPAGHALKVKEFTVSLLWPENDVSGIKGHFFAIAPGAYDFHCELELPGFSATGEGGKQLTPAAGEWSGKLTTRGLNVVVVAPDAPAPKPRVEHVRVRISKDGEVSLDRTKMSLDELKTRAARNAKKWFTIEADEDVPYAKVIEVVEALKAAGVTEFSFSEARVGDGKYRVANRQASYEFDGKHRFSICRPREYPQFFTVSWPAEGERPACWLRTYPNVSEQTQGKWAVVWEPGTDVLWWVDDTDVGKMTLTDPAHVIVDREGRMNTFSRDFGLPNGVMTEFRRLGFAVGRIGQTGPDIGGPTGRQEILSAEPVDAKGIPIKEGAAAPKPDAVQGWPRADVKPERKHLWNDKYAAVAVQSEKDVNFVLVYPGFISTGMSESVSGSGADARWSFEGHVHLVDTEKTKAAGRNVDKRKIAVKYTSDAPTKLFLDGKAYDLATPTLASSKGALEMPGRIFLLRDEGEPFQTDRTLALRNEKDLVTIGDFAMHDRFMAETYADNRRVQKMEGWALAWDTQHPIQHSDGEYVAQMRIFPDGRVLSLSNGRELKEFKITPADIAELTRWLVEEGKVGEWKPEKVKIANTGQELEMSPVKNVWDRETDILIFTRDGKRHGVAVEHGGPGPVFDVIRERLWELAKSGAVAKAADAAPKKGGLIVRARGEWSAEWLALSKTVAESRGLADWKAEDLVAWGPGADRLRSGMLIPQRAKLGDTVKPLLVVRNVSGATKELKVCTSLNVMVPTVRTADGKTLVEVRKIQLRGTDPLYPVTLRAGEQFEFAAPPVIFGIERGADGKPQTPEWPVAGVVMDASTVRVKFHLGNVRGPETGEVTVEVKAPGTAIRGKVLRPDGTPAAGVRLRVDDGIKRWKFRGEGIPELPKPVTTAADGTFSIEVPKRSVAENYNVFADSDDFAPLNVQVPARGTVGVMQFSKGSRVTGRVIGLDGAGLAKVGIWCKRLDWRGRGPAPMKLTSTGADGTFSIPPIAMGRHVLQILTRDLGAKELAAAFANPVIEAKSDAPFEVKIRPLPTVDLTLDARVIRANAEFPDFEVRVSGTLPDTKEGDPAAYWTRQETTKLTEGKHTIAVPAGLQNVQLRADPIYMRKGDDPAFLWQREGVWKREVGPTLEPGVADKPQTIRVTVQDAAMLGNHFTSPDAK